SLTPRYRRRRRRRRGRQIQPPRVVVRGGEMDQIEDADVEMPELVELVDDEGGLQEIIDIIRVHRWKATYERIIATAADVNSLILSNHVQLLYQFDKDLDRADDYFKQAVAVELVDGEAMRRYALTRHVRGDLASTE
ncbi:Os05g0202200, partial [Oryza sativa Japonica Group]